MSSCLIKETATPRLHQTDVDCYTRVSWFPSLLLFTLLDLWGPKCRLIPIRTKYASAIPSKIYSSLKTEEEEEKVEKMAPWRKNTRN
jgi:hypothetical protein